MFAETVYNVVQALPEQEKQRLYNMLMLDTKLITPKQKKDDGQWTKAEAKDYLEKLFSVQAKRNKIKKPEVTASGSKHSYNPFKS